MISAMRPHQDRACLRQGVRIPVHFSGRAEATMQGGQGMTSFLTERSWRVNQVMWRFKRSEDSATRLGAMKTRQQLYRSSSMRASHSKNTNRARRLFSQRWTLLHRIGLLGRAFKVGLRAVHGPAQRLPHKDANSPLTRSAT